MLNKSQTNVKRETFKTYFHNFSQKNAKNMEHSSLLP